MNDPHKPQPDAETPHMEKQVYPEMMETVLTDQSIPSRDISDPDTSPIANENAESRGNVSSGR